MDDVLKSPLTPPLKWAGGKRWLSKSYSHLIPDVFNTYYEPFFGGGAVFFSTRPKYAVLSDANIDLMRTYRAIQVDFVGVLEILQEHAAYHSDEYFYQVRSSRPSDPTKLAAWFLYLNRTCYNGLYRVNKRGQFNVPRGTKDNVLLSTDNFEAVAEALDGCEIVHSDFEPIVNRAGNGDFLFVDPPYTVKHNNNGFVKYNENIFSWSDQERLAKSIVRAAGRGAKILVSNADHNSVRSLYHGIGETITLSRFSVIGGGADYRAGTSEIAVRIGY